MPGTARPRNACSTHAACATSTRPCSRRRSCSATSSIGGASARSCARRPCTRIALSLISLPGPDRLVVPGAPHQPSLPHQHAADGDDHVAAQVEAGRLEVEHAVLRLAPRPVETGDGAGRPTPRPRASQPHASRPVGQHALLHAGDGPERLPQVTPGQAVQLARVDVRRCRCRRRSATRGRGAGAGRTPGRRPRRGCRPRRGSAGRPRVRGGAGRACRPGRRR